MYNLTREPLCDYPWSLSDEPCNPVLFLQLSEAYCLLWQNSRTGGVDGRQGSKAKIGGAVCAVLLDLIAMEKIGIEFEKKKFLFLNYTDIWVKVSWTGRTVSHMQN